MVYSELGYLKYNGSSFFKSFKLSLKDSLLLTNYRYLLRWMPLKQAA